MKPIEIFLSLGTMSCSIYGCGRPSTTNPLPQHPEASLSATDTCVSQQVTIEKPDSDETEEASVTLSGTLDNECADMWLVVHPLGHANYYVQPKVTIGNDGSWLTKVPLGEAGTGTGQTFEIMAFANPEDELDAGSVLGAWPEAEARSDVVRTTRKAIAAPGQPAGPPVPALSPDCRLSIIEPPDGASVLPRHTVKVQVHESCDLSEVWLVVHPTEISTYYVQPRLSEKSGIWKVQAYFGEPGRNRGTVFEVKAFGFPSEPLHEGDELPYWPEAAVASVYIEVKRR
jgi:hypothetical protein